MAETYANERFRLLHVHNTESEKVRIHQETFSCWPFSPELLSLLEDHILLSSVAQETRDMIRILAQVFKSRGDTVPFITPADFFVDGESDEVQTLVDSISVQAGQEKLRQIAQRNLASIRDSGVNIPNARELLSTIWMRSLSPGQTAGGKPAVLHLDITRGQKIDDNSFQVELALLIENSINIHGDEVQGGPLWLGVSENPRSKVRACARNNKLWDIGAVPTAGMTIYPGKDISHTRNTLRHIFVPETVQPPSRVIILGPNWINDPWCDLDDQDKPSKWDRPILLVIPDQIEGEKVGINSCLGVWLAQHVPKRRNTIRFLLLAIDTKGIYSDEELIYSSRCSFLCSPEGWGADLNRNLRQDFDRPLRAALKSRFNRVAILRKWDFQQPQHCIFDIEKITEQGGDIPSAVEAKILSDLFDPNEFADFVHTRAKDSDTVGSLLDDLIDPPPPNAGEAIPFLGETKIYEFILNVASRGEIVLNVGGTWIGRRVEDATDEDALRNIRSKAYRTGQEMRQVQLGLPGSVGGGTVTVPNPQIDSIEPVSSIVFPGESKGGESTCPATIKRSLDYDVSGESMVKPTVNAPLIKNKKSEEPNTGINLQGYFEAWGISSDQSIESARIEFSGLTAQQIKVILQRIPSTFKANLDITYEEGGKE